jgi:Glycosyl hydrolases family 35
MRAVDHGPWEIVPDDRSAGKTLEQSDLNFLGIQLHQPIKPSAETGHVLAGQADNQIGVNVNAALAAQESQVLFQPPNILPAADEFTNRFVEALHADFKLQRPRRKLHDQFPQRRRQSVGDHLKMQEQLRCVSIQKELQDRAADVQVQVKRPVHEFELPRAAVQQRLHRRQKLVQRYIAHGNIQRRQAELAGERTSTRGLDVDHAMLKVFLIVQVIGQDERGHFRQRRRDDLRIRALAVQEPPAQLGEFQIGLARDDVIGQSTDFLRIRFVTDLRSTDDDGHIGPNALKFGHELRRRGDVPDINSQADDLGIMAKDRLHGVGGPPTDVEFQHQRLGTQRSQIGHQIAQPKRRMGVAGVESGQNDAGHAASLHAPGNTDTGRPSTMRRLIFFTAMFFAAAAIAGPPRISYDHQCFQIDGKDFFIYSGSLHYFRCPKPLWADRLARLKQAGFNCVETYVPWNWHEQIPPADVNDFSKVDLTDLADFVDMATEQFGLQVILRPGPYICAEWDGGGFPQWLITKRPPGGGKALWLRSDDPTYLAWCKHWYAAVAKVIAPRQITHRPAGAAGVIFWQIENEYDFGPNFPPEVKLHQLQALAHDSRDFGIDVPLITCWTSSPLFRQDDFLLRNVIDCRNTYPWFSPDLELRDIARLKTYQPEKPLFLTELQGGWFSDIGPGQKLSGDRGFTAEQIRHVTLLAWAHGYVATNYYMAYGGSNFGDFGASWKTQSYDYAAPIREWGGVGDRYFAVAGLGAFVKGHGVQLARSEMEDIGVSDAVGRGLNIICRRAADGSRFIFLLNDREKERNVGQIVLNFQSLQLTLAYDLNPFDAKIFCLPPGATDGSQGQWIAASIPPPKRPAVLPTAIQIHQALTMIDPGPPDDSWQTLPDNGSVEDAGIFDRRFVFYRADLPVGGRAAFFADLPNQDSFIASLNGVPVDIARQGRNTIGGYLPLSASASNKLLVLYENGGRDNGGDTLDARCGLYRPTIIDGGEITLPLANWVRRATATVSTADTSPDLDDSTWSQTTVEGRALQTQPHQTAVYRTHFDFHGGADRHELHIGEISGDAKIYINGRLVRSADITSGLRQGKNVIAAIISTADASGGIGGGAEIVDVSARKPMVVHWQISGQTAGLIGRWFDANLDDSHWRSVSLDEKIAPSASVNLVWTRIHFPLPPKDEHVWVPWKLHLDAAGNGFVYLNGHALGRWWEVGPQRDYYLPECWLNFGSDSQNTVAFCLRPTAAGAAVHAATVEPYADYAEAR